ncbi:MAG TPA: zinc transporter ZntB [Candidatus Acidoferrum sp.]|nr:zinc transporter ZntB [Candidatus Acidoferrum sp.]
MSELAARAEAPGRDGGLVFAGVLDGKGGVRPCGWDGVRAWRPSQGMLWVHLDYSYEESRRWLTGESGVDLGACAALLTEDPRPRVLAIGDSLLLIFRGVNVNLGAQPEDMVALRLWAEPSRVVTLRHRPIAAAKEQWEALLAGRGPLGPADFVVKLCESILSLILQMANGIDDTVDELEDSALAERREELRARLAHVRRQAIALRRYVAPQRDALTRLHGENASWLEPDARVRLREAADRMSRVVEQLDGARDRAAVTQEELASHTSELINRRLYVLSLIAAIFLPLSLIADVFGAAVGGMPLAHSPYGFLILLGVLASLSGLQIWLFKKLGWL